MHFINLYKVASKDFTYYESLLIDAKEQALIKGNHDLCVILLGSAFEVFLLSALIEECRKKGIKKLPIGRESFKKREKHMDFETAILRGNIKEDLIPYMGLISNKRVAGTKEFNYWNESAYTPRNAIIHRGKYGTEKRQAEIAMESVTQL